MTRHAMHHGYEHGVLTTDHHYDHWPPVFRSGYMNFSRKHLN